MTINLTAIAPIYSFAYKEFNNPDLQHKAQATLSNFLGYVQKTFDGLLESGRALQEVYADCLANSPNGKKVFKEWLASSDFGASRYIASAAMEIYAWFDKLDPRIQLFIRENAQKWSVSALRQLTKVSTNLVKELVNSGKKTAAQLKSAAGVESKEAISQTGEEQSAIALSNHRQPSSEINEIATTPTLSPGVRIVVTGNDAGWNGSNGIVISKRSHTGVESWWILLDSVVSQGLETKHLFTTEQLQLSNVPVLNQKTTMFTQAEVERQIAEALAQRDRSKAEEEMARFTEIRDAALLAAKDEIAAAHLHVQKIHATKQKLLQQIESAQEQVRQAHAICVENDRLTQRVTELENALVKATESSWNNTFSNQAQKIVNDNLAASLEPLQRALEDKEQMITKLSDVVEQQQRQLQALHSSDSDDVIGKFGEVAEVNGWSGWTRRGYRAANGILFRGMDALAAFVQDLTASRQEEVEFSLS